MGGVQVQGGSNQGNFYNASHADYTAMIVAQNHTGGRIDADIAWARASATRPMVVNTYGGLNVENNSGQQQQQQQQQQQGGRDHRGGLCG